MRIVIQGKELEFRVQERKIVTCSVFHQGKEIAADLAICAPGDQFDLREGEKIATTRVADILVQRQQQERAESLKKVDQVFTEVGALSGNVELPLVEGANEIVEKVMAKLDARRAKKARRTLDAFHENFPVWKEIFPRPILFEHWPWDQSPRSR